ncbi:MAG: VanW family protein [Clostridia bacterium]|nr:VanW family protein [Clostridia bacterium]
MSKQKYLQLTIFALAVIAGVFVLLGTNTAYAKQALKPWNVDVEIVYGNDVFRYNLEEQIADVTYEADTRGFYLGYNGRKTLCDTLLEQGLDNLCVYEYLLPNYKQIAKRFDYVCKQKIDAEVTFSANGFVYSTPQDGVSIDVDKLFDLMIKSGGKHTKIFLPLTIDKAVTVAELKQNTVLKGSFTTTYYNSGENRCFNVALATKSLDGITVAPDEEFSFNKTVGARTTENGYKNAKVIMDGNYTDGVGGGVCQVSTTLYNALLLAGFIPKACQHSLISSYVMAGFDAMVSDGGSDLKFVNNTCHNIYIAGKIKGKTVTFTIYGEPNEYKIVRENVEERQPFGVVNIVDKAKYPDLIYDDEMRVITNGSDGVKSKSYLKYYKDGVLIDTKLIRSNNYKRVDKVVAHGYVPRPTIDDVADGEAVAQ